MDLAFFFTKMNTKFTVNKPVAYVCKLIFKWFLIFVTFLLWKTRQVPMTHKNRLHLTVIGTLTYIKYTNNNKGPSTDPFGTPYNILEISENKKIYQKFKI